MNLTRLTHTTSFKLSALYMGIFLLSFLTVGLTVYILTSRTIQEQMVNAVNLEATALVAEYNEGGLSALKDEVINKVHTKTKQFYLYGILSPDGQHLAGNIITFERTEGWATIPQKNTKKSNDDKDYIDIKIVKLSKGYWLGVGYHSDYVEDSLDAVVNAFSWGMALAILFGSIGSAYLTRSFLKKIESITHSTQAIIDGDLKHRLAVGPGNDELDNLSALMNNMLDEICDLIDNIQQVSSDIAHDLRTPLSHLKFRLEETLQEKYTAEQYQEKVRGMLQEIDQILKTFSALLRISQIESGSRRAGFSSTDITAIVKKVVEALTPVAEERGKTVTGNIQDNVFYQGDNDLITQMAYNLIENAIIHSGSGKVINICLAKQDDAITLSVADDGPGIPDNERDKIFRRFYRVDTSRTTPGNGLGLNIVSAIAKLHNARIELSDNNPGLKIAVIFMA